MVNVMKVSMSRNERIERKLGKIGRSERKVNIGKT
jgi:hypothetical protein